MEFTQSPYSVEVNFTRYDLIYKVKKYTFSLHTLLVHLNSLMFVMYPRIGRILNW